MALNPFGDQPRGGKQSHQAGLHPIAAQPPAEPRAQRPEHDAARPMLLEIEICRRGRFPRPGRSSPRHASGAGEDRETVRRDPPTTWKIATRSRTSEKRPAGRVVRVRGDEKQHTCTNISAPKATAIRMGQRNWRGSSREPSNARMRSAAAASTNPALIQRSNADCQESAILPSAADSTPPRRIIQLTLTTLPSSRNWSCRASYGRRRLARCREQLVHVGDVDLVRQIEDVGDQVQRRHARSG